MPRSKDDDYSTSDNGYKADGEYTGSSGSPDEESPNESIANQENASGQGSTTNVQESSVSGTTAGIASQTTRKPILGQQGYFSWNEGTTTGWEDSKSEPEFKSTQEKSMSGSEHEWAGNDGKSSQ
jgi:hypothetical protein